MTYTYFKSLFIMTLLCGTITLSAQQTVGLFQNSEDAYDGYTLFAPVASTTTYLIDNCGELVQSWSSSYRPGQAVYLLEDGTLLRTGNTNNSTFNEGGKGGIIEMIDWGGNVIWDYTISSTTECQHHDIEYLPSGNILAIVWDSYTSAEAAAVGRTTSGSTLWSEKIVEIEPDLVNGGGTIVWEWKVWNHLVQDENVAADNYGSVSDSPELIDINYVSGSDTDEDWLHMNSIDYNADLDQIVLSSRDFDEIWIIDHSTTTVEASGHTGGDSGMGGDLLYRWGNPQTYDQGTSDDQKLFAQHNANWIDDDFTDGGMIMIFNNQAGTLSGIDYSSVDVIETPIDANGDYTYSGNAYGPTTTHWTYVAPVPTDFFGTNVSGATRLPNGNTLICEGPNGRFFEVDYDGNTVWEYVNPVGQSGTIINQYEDVAFNFTFRAERYATDFDGFDGQDLTPQGYIESGSTFNCDLFTTSAQEVIDGETIAFDIYPNPAQNDITVSADVEFAVVAVYDMKGQKIREEYPHFHEVKIDVSQFSNGMYFVQAITNDSKVVTQKIVVEK